MTVFAAENTIPLLENIKTAIIDPLIVLGFGVALIIFLYGVFMAVWGASNPAERDTGRRHIIWGVIGLTIMVSAFGIVNLICDTISC